MSNFDLIDYLLGAVAYVCFLFWLLDMADKKKWGGME